MSVRIITDSGIDLPGELDPRLTVIPLGITFGTTTYADGVDLTNDRFYEMLIESDELPKTSQATPYAYQQVFEQVRSAGEEAVVITLSSALSGTYQSAVTAAADYPEVHVVDSKNVTIGQSLLVLYALRLVDEGLGAAEIAEKVEAVVGRVCLLALLDTLEYLKRGGRIPKSVGAIGELLSIKPVVGVEDGEVVMLGKARGSKNGRNQLHQQVEKHGIDFTMPVLLGYTGLSQKLLKKYLEDNRAIWEGVVAEEDLPITSVGATIGTHVGPGAIALAFFAKNYPVLVPPTGARGTDTPEVSVPGRSQHDMHHELDELLDGHGVVLGGPDADCGQDPREVELARDALALGSELLSRQEEAVHERAYHLLEPLGERWVAVRAQQHARVVARALGQAQDEAHVLREVERIPLEQALVHQALDVAEHLVLDLRQQLVDIVVVEVEGRAVVARAVGDLADRDLLHGFLGVELPERLAEIGPCLLRDLRLLSHGALQSRE